MLPADNIIASLPDYSDFGRKTTLRLNPDKILDLNWNIATQLNTTPTTTNGNKKSKDCMQSCFLIFLYFKCCSDFLLYFYKCSTSMAFT